MPISQYSKPDRDIGFSVEVERSSTTRETSKVVKQKTPSPGENQVLKSQGKEETERPFSQSHLDRHYELRRSAEYGPMFLPKSSRNFQKPHVERKANEGDELVRHMSNLPAYLQRVERREKFREKALSFGVLDWERLEEWKSNRKRTPPRGNTNGSSSSSSFSTVEGESFRNHKKQPSSKFPHLSSSYEDGFSQDVKKSQGRSVQQDLEITPRDTLNQWKIPHRKDKSSGRNGSEKKLERRGKRKDTDKRTPSEKGTSLASLRKHGFSHSSKGKTGAQNSATTRVKELQASDYYLSKKHRPADEKDIVLLLPKHSPKKSCSEEIQPSKLGVLYDGYPNEPDQEIFSDSFSSEEVHSAELYSEIPHSCPLPVGVTNVSECSMRPHSLTHAQTNGASCANAIDTSTRLDHGDTETPTAKGTDSSPNRRFSFGLRRIARSLSFRESSAVPRLRCEVSDGFFSEEVHSAEIYSDILHSFPRPIRVDTNTLSGVRRHSLDTAQSTECHYAASCAFMYPNETPKTSKRFDQEATELAAVKGRHPSPTHRFSLGLSRLSRSLSFKDSSTVPRMSSTYTTVKSGPVTSEVSDSLDNTIRNKANTCSTARSSPLRRLLDPLLKIRITNLHHSTETVQPLTRNLNLASKVVRSPESSVQALLQLTVKNGFPLFKLVDNSSGILVAMKKLTTSGKDDDAGCIYTFYSVHEMKKSGSWINQGHKGKDYGFSYTVVGQMKVSSSHYPDLNVHASKDQFVVRESVLYSVDPRQADQEMKDLTPNRELAAIVVKIPVGNSCDDGDHQRNKGKELIGEGFVEGLRENRNGFRKAESEKSNGTTVIIPGGVHSLPNEGVPSPLIDRWRSGGSCSCGGWDVGCKLRILATEDHQRRSLSCSNTDCFDLFDRGGTQDRQPIFSLRPFEKGNFSVEFSASISLLQALSICVTVITSQKSFDFSEVNNPAEAEHLQESTRVRGEVPTKYVPAPPPSPVGRV